MSVSTRSAAEPPSMTPKSQPPRSRKRLSEICAIPLNSLARMIGSQTFLPTPLEKESDKAAKILTAFTRKGVQTDPSNAQIPTSTNVDATETGANIIDPNREKPRDKVLATIPPEIINNAVGLAIFTTLRLGMHLSGTTGSGILVARLADGSWSPPTGINVHSVGGGISMGVDLFDCVCVINTSEALAAFTDSGVSLGKDVAIAAGPYGAGARNVSAKEAKDKKKPQGAAVATTPDSRSPEEPAVADSRPVLSYVRSRGFYVGVQVDGTFIVERKEANEQFYGKKDVSAEQILKGDLPSQGRLGIWPPGGKGLLEALRAAEG